MAEETQRLLENLVERLFTGRDSPIRFAVEALKDGASLKLCAPGGCAVGKKVGEEFVLVDSCLARPLLGLCFEDVADLRAFDEVKTAEEFGATFLSLVRSGRMKLEIFGSFMELWTLGVGQFLMGIKVLSPPKEYRELVKPLRLRDIAFTEILDVGYLQGLVDELAASRVCASGCWTWIACRWW